MSRKFRNRAGKLVAAAALAVVSIQASAQPVLEEVIVTAQKREQSLQDVPISVSAFSGAALQEAGIKDVFDLQTNTPGLTVDQNQNSTTSNFSIRGVGTGGNNFGQESSVGLYVDGVYRSRQSSMINQLVDMASVEVLRGPQGTLFGRNTLSGAVQFLTEAPDHEGTAFLEATVGNYDLINLSGAASFSAIEDVLAFRVTGFSSQRDGWIENIALDTSDEIFDRDRWGWRAQALWTPTDDLTVRVIVDDSEVDEVCCGSTVFYDNNREDMRYDDGRVGSDAGLEDRGATFISESRLYDNKVAYNMNPTSESEDSGVSVQVDYAMGDYTLTSVSGWRYFDSFDTIDADFTDADALFDTNDAEQESFSQELRVSYIGDRLNYVAGAYYFEQTLDTVSTLTLGKDSEWMAGVFVSTPLDLIFQGTFFPPGEFASDLNEQDHESWAVFGQFDYQLTDALTLTAGLRYSDETKDLKATYTESSDAIGFTSGLFPPTTRRPGVDETLEDDELTGTIKLSYFMNNDIMLYGSFGTGYKAGGTNTDRLATNQDQIFDSETIESFEIGMKAEFPDQALRLNVSLYMADIDDFQVGTFTGDAFNLTNAATVETYGGEVEVIWQATDNLMITGGYSKAVADFDDFANGNCWTVSPFRLGRPDPGGQVRDANGDLIPTDPSNEFFPETCDRTGDRLGTNPEDFFTVSGRQDFRIGDSVSGFVLAEYSYTGDMILDQNNDPLTEQSGYDLVNLRVAMLFENWDLEVTAWGRNVFDEEYNGTAFPFPLQAGKEGAYRREPRTYGLTLRKDF